MDWKSVSSSFHVLPASDVLAMRRMARHQDVRNRLDWLRSEEPPLALLFVSHRWETLEHPDPSGRQLRAIQDFLGRLCTCVEALLVSKEERLKLVPSLAYEGPLQAAEVARRMFGFGPFGDSPAGLGSRKARALVSAAFEKRRCDDGSFREWLTTRIGLWLDYTCMPQRPLSPEEEPEFRRSLGALDELVASAIVVALRQAGDDYAVRGWCASEFFLASERSFARGLFVDIDRLEKCEAVALSPAPAPAGAPEAVSAVMQEAYANDLAAFRRACEEWSSFQGPLAQATPADAWSAYRSLQGSGFYTSEQDPNPFRRALEAIRSLETTLVETWLLSAEPRTVDLGKMVGDCLARHGLHCSESADLVYLGFLLSCHGWVDAFKPLFQDCLKAYLARAVVGAHQTAEDAPPILRVRLTPLDAEVRALLSQVEPCSAATWHSRLSTGPSTRERAVVDQVRRALEANPPQFAIESAVRS